MISIFCLLCLFGFSFSQDITYYVNCPQSGSLSTFKEAVDKSNSDGAGMHNLFICGSVSVTDSQDLNFQVRITGLNTVAVSNSSSSPIRLLKKNGLKDQWTKEAEQRLSAMNNLISDISSSAVAELVLADGVTLNFKKGTIFQEIALIPSSTSTGFTLGFFATTTISWSVVGITTEGSSSKSIVSTGTSFKVSDSVIGVDGISVTDKTVAFSKDVISLGSSHSSEFPFIFTLQDKTDISSCFITSPETGNFIVLAGNKALNLISNTWFNSAIRYQGPMPKLVTSTTEFGYIFQ